MTASSTDDRLLFDEAKENFIEGRYPLAESHLNQLILRGNKDPEVFHMLATIYYDQGKFNKAIRTFKRAIEIDPSYTDASLGLSIVLNDLGRYEEAKQVFNQARTVLDQQSGTNDPYVNEKLALKHDELASLYFRYQRYTEALEQFQKAYNLGQRKPDAAVPIADCLLKLGEPDKALLLLLSVRREHPNAIPVLLKIGKIYYDSHRVPEAVEEWELVLRKDPNNRQAKDYLRLASSVQTTRLTDSERLL